MFIAGLGSSGVMGQTTAVYDKEISRIVGKIIQYPNRTKDLDDLKSNYDQANKTDLDRVKTLLATGQPDIYFEIYELYVKIDNRQKMVMILPEKAILKADLTLVDYKRTIAESKKKASAYLYAHGQKLLQSNDQEAARQAYAGLMKVVGMGESYSDLDKLIRKAVLKGATNVEFAMHNRTGKVISSSVIDRLSVIIWEFKKARYGQEKPAQADNSFAFILRVILDDLQVGPDQLRELEYQEERDIYQGEQPVDTISCLVLETRQLKKAQLSGSLEYVDKQTGKVVNRIPVKVESVFFNAYAELQGDPDAAGEDTRRLLGAKQAEYPSAEQMVLDATEEFAKKAGEIILAE
jgi:hypothetical protein